ncbi:hypothetical protein Anas_00797 [Armadillidium nasatum]|uniref:Fatty acid desaturase domain-containing protein n=1 Tax=Armadillidium nasatum TaxID=96803 RepID=A0A5N5T194_9CRUS|nr:hypothetical protein Anas_00797 [Armadillidium nasatum]
MKLMQDSLLFGFLVFSILAARNFNIFYAIIAGIFLNFMVNVAHNFFHQRDNWRMLIFDLTLNSSREWRISHALSHHNYPNTIIDYEVSALEPHFELLPKSNKSFLHRYAVIVTGSILYSVAIYSAFVYRVILYKMGKTKFYKEDILPFLHLFLIIGLCGSLIQGLQFSFLGLHDISSEEPKRDKKLFEGNICCISRIWLVIHTVGYYFFTLIGLTAGHHHPNIYHEGDKHLEEKDWGLHQILATRERGELFMNNVFLASISFGNHTLHHLFPTVDHSKLPYLQEVLLETCKEFDIKFEVYTPWETFKGLYLQLATIKPNLSLPSIMKKM